MALNKRETMINTAPAPPVYRCCVWRTRSSVDMSGRVTKFLISEGQTGPRCNPLITPGVVCKVFYRAASEAGKATGSAKD